MTDGPELPARRVASVGTDVTVCVVVLGVVAAGVVEAGVVSAGVVSAGFVSAGVVGPVAVVVAVVSPEPPIERTTRIPTAITATMATTARTTTAWRCPSPSEACRGGASGTSSCQATSSVSTGSWNGVANQSSSSARTGL